MSEVLQHSLKKGRNEHKEVDLEELVSPRVDDGLASPFAANTPSVRRMSVVRGEELDADILPGSPSEHSTRANKLDASRASMGGSKFDRMLHSNILFEAAAGSPRTGSPLPVKRNNFVDEGASEDEDASARRGARAFQSEGGVGRILSVTTPRASQRGLEDDTSSPHVANRGSRKASQIGWEADSGAAAAHTVTEGSEGEGSQHSSGHDGSPRPSAHRISSSSTQEWVAKLREAISSGHQTPEVFLRDGPKGGLVRCYVLRKKNAFGGSSSYQLYLAESDSFLLAARKRKKTKSSVFIISQSVEDLHRDSENCLAKLKANFVGTEFELWGRWDDKSSKKGYGQELMGIAFCQSGVAAKGGPRIMRVARPVGSSRRAADKSDAPESLVGCLLLADRRELAPSTEKQLILMSTKLPHYDAETKVYSLDFNGRVKEASVKNFQLVTWDHNSGGAGETVLLQFGKVTSDSFILDFSHPFCLHSAFAIALASIDSKLCYSF